MLGLPLAPIIQGCEVDALKAQAPVLVSGFGLDEKDPSEGALLDEKRWVATRINQVTEQELSVGGEGKGGCQGDSGGPVYLKLSDGSYRTIGVTHGGAAHPNCDQGIYKRADKLLDWYERQLRAHAEDEIDLRPCFDDAGTWAPSEACGGYTKDVQGPHGDWSNNCGGALSQRYSASCGAPFDPNQVQASTSQGSSGSTGSPPLLDNSKDATGEDPAQAPPPAPMRSDGSGSSGCQLATLPPGAWLWLNPLILALGLHRLRRR